LARLRLVDADIGVGEGVAPLARLGAGGSGSRAGGKGQVGGVVVVLVVGEDDAVFFEILRKRISEGDDGGWDA
jgi:hypothetical protein